MEPRLEECKDTLLSVCLRAHHVTKAKKTRVSRLGHSSLCLSLLISRMILLQTAMPYGDVGVGMARQVLMLYSK